MKRIFFENIDEATLVKIAYLLEPTLAFNDSILLYGDLGAGKSTFARGIITSRLARHKRHEDVPSPTFTLVQIYDFPDGDIWHADLYRLSNPNDCDELGLFDAFEDNITLIEWPERIENVLPQSALNIHLTHNDTSRNVEFSWNTVKWDEKIQKLNCALKKEHRNGF